MEPATTAPKVVKTESARPPAPVEPRPSRPPVPVEPRPQPVKSATSPAVPVKMADPSAHSLAALVSDATKLREAVKKSMKDAVAPGQISVDEANRLMGLIANEFEGVPRAEVELSLLIWGALNGTGGEDDYSQKPPVVAGGKSVVATRIFGPIVPVGVSGIARQFMSTMFEDHVADVLKADPTLVQKLAPRIARAGLNPGQAICVIDFVRGVSPATQGGSADRQRAKEHLIARKAAGGRFAGGPRVAPPAAVADLGDATRPSGGENFWG